MELKAAKRWVFPGLLVLLFVMFFHIFNQSTEEYEEPAFTEFLTKAEQRKVKSVHVRGNTYFGRWEDTHNLFRTYGPPADAVMVQKLRDLGLEVKFDKQ